MCCRYYIDVELPEDILRIIMNPSNVHINISDKDIRPTDAAPVIRAAAQSDDLQAVDMRWGFAADPGTDRDGFQSGRSLVMINSRCETVLEKKSFAQSMLLRRCIVPARHFYEWDREKNKCICGDPGGRPVYMAGIYKAEADGDHFTILTTAANASMRTIHDRMPLLLSEDQVGTWIKDGARAMEYLKVIPEPVRIKKDYEQLSFNF